MDAFRKWLGTPRKLSEKIQERKISWLELFTDLAYVVMLHALITNYSEHRETTSIWVFLLFFLLFFYIWSNFVSFFTLHGDHSARTTLLNLTQMVVVLLLTSRLSLVFEGELGQFVGIYIFIQALLIYLWTLVVRADPEHIESSRLYLITCWINLVLLLAVEFVGSESHKLILLAIVVVLQVSVMLVNSHYLTAEMRRRNLPIVESESSQERYGQLIMIVLGEALALITETIMGPAFMHSLVWFIAFIVNIIGLWWIYYAFMDNISLHVKHDIFIELLHLFNEILTIMLVIDILLMYLFLESHATFYMGLYCFAVAITVAIVFGIKCFATPHRDRHLFHFLGAELVGLFIVASIGSWLPAIIAIWLVNCFLAMIIFNEERYQLEAQRVEQGA